MEERSFHPLDYVSVLKRRKMWFIVPVAVSIVAGAVAAFLMPREYESKASIAVEAPTLSPELLRGVSSLDAAERQRAISHYLLSPAVLERVAREERISRTRSADEMVPWLRRRIDVRVPQPIGANTRISPERGIDSFDLVFRDGTPDRTQRVANRLAEVFVEENSKRTAQRAENTVEVLGQQLRVSQDRLNEIEEQLRRKKEQFMGRLPNQIDANLQTLNGLRNQLESISTQLNGEINQLMLIETQLQQMRQGNGSAVMTQTGAAAVQVYQGRIMALNQQLAAARANGYTEKHPEIISLQQEIAQARKEMSTMNREAGGDVLGADPMYRQKVAERDAAKARIATLRRAESQARGQIGYYQSRVEAAPMVEQEMAGVVREHERESERYKDLKKKYDEALLGGDIARQQGGERFSVLYRASTPRLVSTPGWKVFLIALGAGFVLGAGLMVGREFVDRSVYDARALQNEFELPVLGEIPTIHRAA